MFDVGTLESFDGAKHFLVNVTNITNMVFDGDPKPQDNIPFVPKPGVVYTVDHRTFSQCIEPTRLFKLGAVIELNASGQKVNVGDPNIITDDEIADKLLSKRLSVEKKLAFLESVTSHFTRGRILEYMKGHEDEMPASLMNYLSGTIAEDRSKTIFVGMPPDEAERKIM